MIELKQLNLKFAESDLDKVKADKRKGESWEEYVFRKCVTEGKK